MQPRQLERSRVRSILAWGERVLRAGPHPERARLDAEALLLYVFKQFDPNRNRAWLMAHQSDPTSSDTRIHFEVTVGRRLTGEPIQYILGQTEFYGLPFRVTPSVLIPRPETEHLVEQAIALAAPSRKKKGTGFSPYIPSPPQKGALAPEGHPRILDIGTGSGCIAIALAHHLPHAAITAIDLSPDALALARENAAQNQVEARIRFLQGDLLAPVPGEKFDIILSNPPYVPTTDRPTLSVEVRDHEPALALFAGNDGLDIYRRLIPAAYSALAPAGLLALEIGYSQQSRITELLTAASFESIDTIPDLQGIPRVICAVRRHA
jgi:release factor glutamine methyltransferase